MHENTKTKKDVPKFKSFLIDSSYDNTETEPIDNIIKTSTMTDFTLQEAENLLKSISEKKQYEKSIMKGKLFCCLIIITASF